MRPTVVYAFPTSHIFRAPFHELLKKELASRGIDYLYIYSNQDDNFGKNDTINISWAQSTPLKKIDIFGKRILWHKIGRAARRADLLILQQQNNLIGNYFWQLTRKVRGQRVAFFGHGKNFQAKSENSLSEKLKRLLAIRIHWWFTYTEGCRELISEYGYPKDRITVFNNSIDLATLKNEVLLVSQERIRELRTTHFNGSDNVCVYVGGMYSHKRLEFLLRACEQIRESIPDFHMVFIGDGPDAHLVENFAQNREWVHPFGSKFGIDKSELVLCSKLWLMPGLVGLAVLDSFAYGVPMVTTQLKYHSPEFDYLIDGLNGSILHESDNTTAYASRVIELLHNDEKRLELREGALSSSENYSIEKMVHNFADGVEDALDSAIR